MLGIKIVGLLETLDIMFDLTSVSAAKTDDSSDFSAVYEGHGVQDAGRGGEGDHSDFAVIATLINPYKSVIPIEFRGQSERDAMLPMVAFILGRVEVN